MSSIKGKDTKPEVIFRKALWDQGIKGYRLHYKTIGRPDIALVNKKIAIFIHGCYWHRCPKCDLPVPRSNTGFWKEKFHKNVERDKGKERLLKEAGWAVFVIWECEIKKDLQKTLSLVIDHIHKR
jgi:DNA mismatch endonuclease (patch repair protein)